MQRCGKGLRVFGTLRLSLLGYQVYFKGQNFGFLYTNEIRPVFLLHCFDSRFLYRIKEWNGMEQMSERGHKPASQYTDVTD